MSSENGKIQETDVTQALLEECRAGKEAAFRQLYDRYCKAMYNTCFRILNNHEAAKDAMQEGFIKAFAQMQRFDERSTFGYWLKRIMVNESITELRKGKKIVTTEHVEDYAERDEPVEEQYNHLDIRHVHAGIQALAPGYRAVLSLYLLEGYDHQEIAQILNVAESTTRTQFIRAKKKLQENLKSVQL